MLLLRAIFVLPSVHPFFVDTSESAPGAGRDSPVRKCPHLYQRISLLTMQPGSGERDHNAVLNLADPRRGPGRVLRRLLLGIGTHRPSQDDLAALYFDRDIPGIDLRVAHQLPLDALLQVAGRHTRLDRDEIGHAFDP